MPYCVFLGCPHGVGDMGVAQLYLDLPPEEPAFTKLVGFSVSRVENSQRAVGRGPGKPPRLCVLAGLAVDDAFVVQARSVMVRLPRPCCDSTPAVQNLQPFPGRGKGQVPSLGPPFHDLSKVPDVRTLGPYLYRSGLRPGSPRSDGPSVQCLASPVGRKLRRDETLPCTW